MTRALWTAGLGVVMVLAGLAFGPTPLLVPGVGLVLLGVLSAVWVTVAVRGRLERRLGSVRIVEGEACPLELELHTPIALPPGSELVEPLAPTARCRASTGAGATSASAVRLGSPVVGSCAPSRRG